MGGCSVFVFCFPPVLPSSEENSGIFYPDAHCWFWSALFMKEQRNTSKEGADKQLLFPAWHFHSKTLPYFKNATTWVCVGVCQNYANESALLLKATNGINEGNQHEHVCFINSAIIGPCESVFISIHWNNLAQKTDKLKKCGYVCLLSLFFVCVLFFLKLFLSPAALHVWTMSCRKCSPGMGEWV